MAENSKIEWCDHTFNTHEGCEQISPGCANCYAKERDRRFHEGKHWGPNGTRKFMTGAYWRQPLKWNVRRFQCALCGTWNHPTYSMCANTKCSGKGEDFVFVEHPRVFCASLGDVFEDRPELDAVRRRLLKLIQKTPNLDWLLLTKRPENIHRLTYKAIDPTDDSDCEYNIAGEPNGLDVAEFGELYPNVWLGTSVENQEMADKRIPELLKIPARVRFLSCEPLLGPVDLIESFPALGCSNYIESDNKGQIIADGRGLADIHWVIVGGESGSGARPMEIGWLNSIRDQCIAAGVPVFIKQMGSEYAKRHHFGDSKGGDWNEWAAEYRIRQFPA